MSLEALDVFEVHMALLVFLEMREGRLLLVYSGLCKGGDIIEIGYMNIFRISGHLVCSLTVKGDYKIAISSAKGILQLGQLEIKLALYGYISI